MELIRRNTDYALRGLAYLAKFPKGKPLNIEAIAAKQGVPALFFRKIFQRLSSAKIVDSKTGPRGGFYLLKDARELNLNEVLEATQGKISLSDCLFERKLCERSRNCKIRKRLSGAQQQIADLLKRYTLDDFLD